MYTVKVDDNWAFMDEDARRTLGRFETEEEAKAACRALVERSLDEQFTPGMTAAELIAAYRLTGEDPFILSDGGARVAFSAWDYAAVRAAEICAKA